MANVTRVIYTQGAVNIKSVSAGVAHFTGILGNTGLFLSGVQSANFSAQTPRQDVNSFGVLGGINKVQVEPATATLEVSLLVNSGNLATHTSWLSGLCTDAMSAVPSGVVVTASGVGQVSGAVLSSFRVEAAVGSIPTLSLTFDGISGAPQTAQPATTTPNAQTVDVATPANFGTLYWKAGGAGITGCPQSVRASWEMQVERINCLGNDVNAPTVFSRPPGTVSFTVEGVDPNLVGNFLTGVQIGPYKLATAAANETSRSVNMAVGEAASTFNVTSEGVAMGAVVLG